MESFFCSIHEFLTDAEMCDVTNFLCNNFPSADVDDNVVDPSHSSSSCADRYFPIDVVDASLVSSPSPFPHSSNPRVVGSFPIDVVDTPSASSASFCSEELRSMASIRRPEAPILGPRLNS